MTSVERCVLQSAAVGQYEDTVGRRRGFDRVVRDDQADPVEGGQVGAQGVTDPGPGRLVQRGQGFAQEQQPGLGGQRPGQGDPLGLAARQLRGLAAGEMADAKLVEPHLRPPACLLP